MIISFRHKGLEALYHSGSAHGVQAVHVQKLNRILAALDARVHIMMKNHPHPGELLREDVLIALGMEVTDAAHRLGMSRTSLSRPDVLPLQTVELPA